MLKLVKNIENNQFYNLLDICFNFSDYFTLTNNRWSVIDNELYDNFLKEISPFYLKTIKTHDWYCMHTLPNNLFEIYLYKADKEVREIIQKYHDNLFFRERNFGKPLRGTSDKETKEILRKYFDNVITIEEIKENDKWGNTKDLPEDICFFISNKLFLGTVSHEDICTAYPTSEEIKKQLLELGEWEEVDDAKEEQIIFKT